MRAVIFVILFPSLAFADCCIVKTNWSTYCSPSSEASICAGTLISAECDNIKECSPELTQCCISKERCYSPHERSICAAADTFAMNSCANISACSALARIARLSEISKYCLNWCEESGGDKLWIDNCKKGCSSDQQTYSVEYAPGVDGLKVCSEIKHLEDKLECYESIRNDYFRLSKELSDIREKVAGEEIKAKVMSYLYFIAILFFLCICGYIVYSIIIFKANGIVTGAMSDILLLTDKIKNFLEK
ncbi:MAG: hypothetical protein AB9873_13055 [Syntrophobacteraceae bacterium]